MPVDEIKELKAAIPKDKDFTQLIDRFDKIAQNKSQVHKKLLLREATTFEELMMLEGDNQYLRVQVRGKKCPLRVYIKRKKGKIETYTSKTVPEPNDELCDACFKKDKFQVIESGLKFRVEMIFFCLHAVSDTIFSFSIGFGPEKRGDEEGLGRNFSYRDPDRLLHDLRKDEGLRDEYRKKAEKALHKRKMRALQLSKHKDFVKINKKMQPHTSPGRLNRRVH